VLALSRWLLSGLVCVLLGDTLHAAKPEQLLADFARAQLITVTAERGCTLFDVFVAQTPDQRAQGLMRIEQLDEHEGMIFLYERTANISMWMKNTIISLDMLFIAADATVASIHTDAVPMSEDIIHSGTAVAAVLELNAGSAERFGIRPGDRIIITSR